MSDLTGNGIVNNGPEDEPGGDLHSLSGASSGGGGGGGNGDAVGDGGVGEGGSIAGDVFGGDELALRRLMHGAVQGLAPSEGALDHLRRAVPARRARKRQAVVGVAAAVLLIGTAVPAFVHVASTGNSAGERPVNVGHREHVQGGTGTGEGAEDGEKGSDDTSKEQDGGEGGSGKPDSSNEGAADTTGGTSGGGGYPPDDFDASAAVCDAGQLGVSSAQTGAPEPDGNVYGSFRIANVSGSDCSVGGQGSIVFQTAGAADASKIEVVHHTAGDAAIGLPDPSLESAALVLEPSAEYEVKFAWVPTDTCPTDEPTPDPSTTESTSGSVTSGAGGPSDTQSQLGRDDGPDDGSIDVVHTPDSGSTSAETTIDNACAGTIYRTGVLEAS